jgi:hypothetical protein
MLKYSSLQLALKRLSDLDNPLQRETTFQPTQTNNKNYSFVHILTVTKYSDVNGSKQSPNLVLPEIFTVLTLLVFTIIPLIHSFIGD